MTRDEFALLYVNASALAEQALRHAALDFEAEGAWDSPAPAEGDLPADAFEGLDFGALDGLAFFGDEEEPVVEDPETTGGGQPPTSADEEFSIERYLHASYATLCDSAVRYERAFAAADVGALSSLLERLPIPPAPLTGKLDGLQFGAWLERYLADEPALAELVTRIRQLPF